MKVGENNSRKTGGSVAALKELVSTFVDYWPFDFLLIKLVVYKMCENVLQCTVEGYNLVFQAPPSGPDGSVGKETYAQVSQQLHLFEVFILISVALTTYTFLYKVEHGVIKLFHDENV